jgi:hypothetical protein
MGDKRMENTMVKNINLDLTPKTRVTIDGDESRFIELNTSDMGIIERMNNLSTRMNELSDKALELKTDDEVSTEQVANEIRVLDAEMRNIVDELFQASVSSVCVPNGTMFDMFNGDFMYERIITALVNLYVDNIGEETKKTLAKIHKHTNKYIPQDHKQKS